MAAAAAGETAAPAPAAQGRNERMSAQRRNEAVTRPRRERCATHQAVEDGPPRVGGVLATRRAQNLLQALGKVLRGGEDAS